MDERKRLLQEKVRRDNQKRLAVQRVIWSIIAIILAIAGIFVLIQLILHMDRPERHAKRFIATASTRSGYKTPEYSEAILGSTSAGKDFPAFYDVTLKDKKVLRTMGPEEKEVEVDVILQFQGEMVAGTSGAKQRREAGEKGPTHNIFQHWQKLRNSELHPKGDWKTIATEIGPIQ